jgi:hypothetical protein
MTTIFGLLATVLAQQTPDQLAAAQQANAMRIALITIAALAATNVLLVILIFTGRKKKAD